MKAAISQNVTCAVETAAITCLYSAILFIGAQMILTLG